MKKLSVGYFTDTYTPSINGVVTSILSFRKETQKLGHKVYVFAPKIPKHRETDERVFRFPSLPSFVYKDIRDSFPVSPKILLKIPRLRLDLLHIQTPGQIGLLGTFLAAKYSLPTVFTYHTNYPEYFAIYKRATPALIIGMLAYPWVIRSPKAYKELAKVAASIALSKHWNREIAVKLSVVYIKQMDGVIAPSRKIKNLLISWGVSKPIALIPTGIEFAEFEGSYSDVRKKYKLGKGPVVTFMGRLGKEKNVDLLLEAFKKVVKEVRGAKLLIIGDGPYKKELEEKARKLSISRDVVFTGFLRHKAVVDALKSSDLFVFPSLTDTQGLAVLEAAACSLPLIMVDREIAEVLHPGKNGFWALDDAGDLAKKIIKIVSDPDLARRFGAYSKQAARKYSAEQLNLKLLLFYNKIIKKKKKGKDL